MALFAMAYILAACGNVNRGNELDKEGASGSSSEVDGTALSLPAYEVPAPPRMTVPDEEEELPRKKESLTHLAPVTDENGMTISEWPSIELSGDPDEVIRIEEDCFYEDERFFLFFQEGVRIHGDVAEHMERIMSELEDLLQLSYDRDPVNSDINWRYLYFDNAFMDVNRDLAKVNILILKNPEDDRIEWAGENVAVLFEDDVYNVDDGMEVAYHELAHVLQLRQASPLGRVLSEGIAMYAEYKLSVLEGRPDYSLFFYLRHDDGVWGYDETPIYEDPLAAFYHDTETPSGHEDWEYQYGFRFAMFLVETYGEDVFDTICRISLQFTYEEQRTDMIIRVIKDATSEDVFERFAQWLPEGWEEFTEEYESYMSAFEAGGKQGATQPMT